MPLIFVPTPLGNLRDVTLRALDVLRDASLIVAEDTRVARKLLHALELGGREIWSYREQNAAAATPAILERARDETVAVTADAGMPGISDPGSALIAAAREAGVPVEALPGPSAALGVALLSGFPLRRFTFEGFPPRGAAARRERFAAALRGGVTTLWYESPRRLHASLADLARVAPDARLFVVREYTKLHEQQLWGTAQDVLPALPEPLLGEVAFAVAPYAWEPQVPAAEEAAAAIDALLASGRRVGEVAKLLAARGFGERRQIYARAAARKARREGSINQS
ncbi:MAG: 16S rRNA (cytidine(1402)-2'-O)-methyltransferase [Candidatus Eremiobacteraeota bacterium]|nr:16S rRNA (cytidine(1402)-2'-O)-methyltransferase [Candidatus Eremiobacteraeota bacterium]MBV8500004.1 16S rRNA (cytidine(1402)-2'-O)-methyltransferase [Candidatus Eremiobacteraeota bacterium]